MLFRILAQRAVSIKQSKRDGYPHTIPLADQGTLIIRLRRNRIDSVEILADQSYEEDRLVELWDVLRPAVDVALVNAR